MVGSLYAPLGRDFKHCLDETGLSFSQFIVLMRLYHGAKSDVSGSACSWESPMRPPANPLTGW